MSNLKTRLDELRPVTRTALNVLVALDYLAVLPRAHGEIWVEFRAWRAETAKEAERWWSPWTFYQAVRILEQAGCIRRRPGFVQLINHNN